MLNGDRAVMLIFNQNGRIAGIASSLPKNLPFNFPSQNIRKYFNDEGQFYSISAYFTDPNTVCQNLLNRQLTGDRLVFKSNTFEQNVALMQSNLNNQWTQGRCFITMGRKIELDKKKKY